MTLSKNKDINILFFLSVSLLVASMISLYVFSDKYSQIDGPYMMDYSSKHGYVLNINKDIYRLSMDGTILAKQSYHTLGLKAPGDIEFVDDRLYISDGKKMAIYSCDVHLTDCYQISKLASSINVKAVDISVTPNQKYFYTTISGEHKIDKYRINGEHLYTLSVDSILRYPNGIVAMDDNRTIVTDTNNHRIIGIEEKYSNANVVWEKDVRGEYYRQGYKWPIALSVDALNNIWVVNLDGFFEHGDVVVYDGLLDEFNKSNLSELTRLEFESYNARPSGIVATDNKMLIGDMRYVKLYMFDLNAKTYERFGSVELQRILEKYAEAKERYKDFEWYAQVAIVISIALLVLTAFMEIMQTKKQTTPKREVGKPKTNNLSGLYRDSLGIAWIEGKTIKLYKYLGAFLIGLYFCFIIIYKFFIGNFDTEVLFALLGLGVLCVPAGIALFFVKAQRIGIKKNVMHVMNIFGKHASDNIENVKVFPNRILVKNVAVVLKDGHGRDMFDPDEIDRYLVPLLESAQKESELDFFVRNLFQFDKKTWLSAIGFILVLILWFYVEVYL